jgi:hypothetical protein
MMIGAHVGGIAKEDLGFFALRQGFDPRVFLLEPLLYQSLVAFPRAVQGLLAAADPHGSCDNVGAFTSLNATHGAHAHRLQRRVIQLASIVLSHPPSESDHDPPCQQKYATTYGPLNKSPWVNDTDRRCMCSLYNGASSHLSMGTGTGARKDVRWLDPARQQQAE